MSSSKKRSFEDDSYPDFDLAVGENGELVQPNDTSNKRVTSYYIASYNISFASGLGYDPRRANVFESEGNFLMNNVNEQLSLQEIDFKKYWQNAAELVKQLWSEKNIIFMGFQEMNEFLVDANFAVIAGSNGQLGTAEYLFNKLRVLKPEISNYIGTIDAPQGGKTTLMSVWNTNILGISLNNGIYDLGEGDGAFGIGRPITFVFTDKNNLLINLHAPNKPADSLAGYPLISERIKTRITQFISEKTIRNVSQIFLVGDFNDRYNGLQGKFNVNIVGKEFALTIGNGIAPFSCCYNGDSACSNARLTNPDPTGQSPCINKQTCTVPPDMIMAGPNRDGKLRKPLDGEEGNLANYRYTGDYCFAQNPVGNLTIYTTPNRIVSKESDHELVYLGVSMNPSYAGGRNKKTRKSKRKSKRNKGRKTKKYNKSKRRK